MTWGWSRRGPMPIDLGGNTGSVEESKVAHAWPSYEAEYLKKRLNSEYQSKYQTSDLYRDDDDDGAAVKAAYLDKVTENYKQEADECLHGEFMEWLQGLGTEHRINNINTKGSVYQ